MLEIRLQFLGALDSYIAIPLVVALGLIFLHLLYNLLRFLMDALNSMRDGGSPLAPLREYLQSDRNCWRYLAISFVLFIMGFVLYVYLDAPTPTLSDMLRKQDYFSQLVNLKAFSMIFFVSAFMIFYAGLKDIVKMMLYTTDTVSDSDIQRRLNEVASMSLSSMTQQPQQENTQAMAALQNQLEAIRSKVDTLEPAAVLPMIELMNKRLGELSSQGSKAVGAVEFKQLSDELVRLRGEVEHTSDKEAMGALQSQLGVIRAKIDSLESRDIDGVIELMNKRLGELSSQGSKAVGAVEFKTLADNLSTLKGEVGQLMKASESSSTTKSMLESMSQQVRELAERTPRAGSEGINRDEFNELNRNFAKFSESITPLLFNKQAGVKDEVKALHEQLRQLATRNVEGAKVSQDDMKNLASRVDNLTTQLSPVLSSMKERTDYRQDLTQMMAKLNSFMKDIDEKVKPITELREEIQEKKRKEVVFDRKAVEEIIGAKAADDSIVFSTVSGNVLYSNLPPQSNKFVIAVMVGRMLASSGMLSRVLVNKGMDHLQLITESSRAIVRVSRESWILVISRMEKDFMQTIDKSAKLLEEVNAAAMHLKENQAAPTPFTQSTFQPSAPSPPTTPPDLSELDDSD